MRRRRDVPFSWMFWMFGAFIIGCGFTHFMEVFTFYVPMYRLAALIKVGTALVSVATVIGLIPLIPKAMALRSPEELEREIQQRIRAEQKALASLREKDVLLKEIHHRVKNNLAVVSSLFYLQSAHTKDPETIRLLQDSQDRVRSMALVHEMLYRSDDLTAVDFGKYAADLAQTLLRTHSIPGRDIKLTTDVEPVQLSIERAVPCGLILNELLTNAMKHAFALGSTGELLLRLKRCPNDRLLIAVSDNGVGLPEETRLNGTRSLGLRLIQSLTRQLDAHFEFIRKQPGTEARVELGVHDDVNR